MMRSALAVGMILLAVGCLVRAEGTAVPAAAAGTKVTIVVDAGKFGEMTEWAAKVKAVAEVEYPKIAALFASEGFKAPEKVRIVMEDYKGVAATGGDVVHLSATYFKGHAEDVGAVVHELVHVVQAYQGKGGHPGWLVEGIADWYRFYRYEPKEARPRVDVKRDDYKKGYRVAAAFLEWMDEKYGGSGGGKGDLVVKVNAAFRGGTYGEKTFEDLTGKKIEALWEEYVKAGGK